MTTPIFRPATKADLPTLLQFEQGIIITERPFNPTIRVEEITYYDISAFIDRSDAEIIVATLDNQIVASGYALIKSAAPHFTYQTYAYLGFMYVLPEYRGKGINQLLIKNLTQWAREQDVFEVRLQVYTDNLAAIRAYQKIGFKNLMVEMRLDLSEVVRPVTRNLDML